MKTPPRRYLIPAALLAACLPLSISPSGGIQVSRACANGTCCSEPRSICYIDDFRVNDAYWNGPGPCSDPTQPAPPP